MPNTPIGSNRPRLEPFARHNDVGAGAATTRSADAGTTPATEPHADLFRRVDAESLNAGEGRRAGNVSSLSAAPGLLNGSVVLPHSGNDHPAVGQLQGALQMLAQRQGDQALHVPRTGTWDAATAEAVSAFQRSEGLVADGVVGPRTAAALDKALKRGQPNNVLLGRIGGLPTSAPALDPTAVGKSAEMLIEKYGGNYGVPDAWYNIDPNHALPANVRLGGMSGKWKCNLFGGNAMRAAGFEPPYYGNRGKGEYPNANQFYKWSDKYAAEFGNKVHFEMVSELDVEGLDPEARKDKIIEFMKTIQPGDLVMSDHRGDTIADGGHTRVAVSAFDPETMSFQAAQASSDAGRIKDTTYGAFSGEETIWVLRPNRPAED